MGNLKIEGGKKPAEPPKVDELDPEKVGKEIAEDMEGDSDVKKLKDLPTKPRLRAPYHGDLNVDDLKKKPEKKE